MDSQNVSHEKKLQWKVWDKKAVKTGPHHSIYWVKKKKQDIISSVTTTSPSPSYVSGIKYTGDWKDNQKHGYGTQVWTNGNKFEGEWVQNKRNGKGTFWVRRQKKLMKQYIGDWKDDARTVGSRFTSQADITIRSLIVRC